jgi:hypothetical protein
MARSVGADFHRYGWWLGHCHRVVRTAAPRRRYTHSTVAPKNVMLRGSEPKRENTLSSVFFRRARRSRLSGV